MKLKDVGDYFIGLTYKPDDVSDSGVIVLRSGNIQDQKICYDDIVRVDKKIPEKLYVQPGDILMCSRNGSARLVGKTAIIPQAHERMTFGAFMTVFRTPVNEYLQYFFSSMAFRRQLSIGKTTTINQITINMLDNIDIAIPDSATMDERCKKLNTISQIIDDRKKELSALDTLIKARFVEMFGDPVNNDRNWPTLSLEESCDGIGDGLHGTPEYDEHGEYPFINGNNLIDGRIVVTPATKMVNEQTFIKNKSQLGNNAVLISINGTLGKMAFYHGESIMLGKSACYCNLKPTINREFVYQLMRTEAFAGYLDDNSTKSTIKNVGLKAMRSFRLIQPPKDAINSFVAFSRQVDKSKVAVQAALEKAQMLFDSLMQQYFG